MAQASSYTLVLALTERAGRLLNVGVFFTADSTNIQRISKMLVGAVLFCGGFRTLLDRGYGFDDIYSFLLPRLGAARLQNRRLYVSDSSRKPKGPGGARSTRVLLVIVVTFIM